jgi:hypothetical protein
VTHVPFNAAGGRFRYAVTKALTVLYRADLNCCAAHALAWMYCETGFSPMPLTLDRVTILHKLGVGLWPARGADHRFLWSGAPSGSAAQQPFAAQGAAFGYPRLIQMYSDQQSK